MKKLFLTLIVAFFTITGGIAQNVTVEEPGSQKRLYS